MKDNLQAVADAAYANSAGASAPASRPVNLAESGQAHRGGREDHGGQGAAA